MLQAFLIFGTRQSADEGDEEVCEQFCSLGVHWSWILFYIFFEVLQITIYSVTFLVCAVLLGFPIFGVLLMD